jgi:hypothetical protein
VYVDWDDYPTGDSYTEGVFATQEKARDFLFEITGQESARSYGYARRGHKSFSIREHEVSE